MRINPFKKTDRPATSLRARLLGIFVIFCITLMGLLWVFQSGFLERYYEFSMERKCRNGVNTISDAFANDKDLSYEEFCEIVGEVAEGNDLYIYMESLDGGFTLSSTDVSSSSRVMPEGKRIFSDAKRMLMNNYDDEIYFTAQGIREDKLMVFAKEVESETRGSLFLYAIAFLSPLGPAVSILRSQLMIVTILVIAAGLILAVYTSNRLSEPLAQMSKDAKRLGEGDFDVHFTASGYTEINELADTLNVAAAQLKATDALRKDIMANVSHDLRTPLTMIKSYAEMIRDLSGDNKEKREEHLGVIIEETDRLSKLVNEILLLSKFQSGVAEFENKPFDIQKAAGEIVQTYKVMESEGYTISFEPIDEEVIVNGDEQRIKQVISNLISNAVKYSEERKDIRVYFEKEEGYIKLVIEDHGMGIAEDQLERIWSRYQRASQRTARSKDGSGLGLSICSEILKRSGAEYGVESKLGEGSKFWFKMKIV